MTDSLIDAVLPKLEGRVAEVVAQTGVPGVSVGVVRDQALAWSGGFGWADVESRRRPDERTLYRVGSITKTFTGAAVMQLRDAGKLRLDDPLVRHIPEFAAVRNPFGPIEDVTLRRLLAHRSGLQGEPPTGHWATLDFPSMGAILDSLDRVEVVIPPDSAFKYCNLAFALLGEVVERVAGRPYAAYVEEEILVPLGMSASGFEVGKAQRPRLATGYTPDQFADDLAVAPHEHINGETAAGQLYSSVEDLAKWIALQFRTDAGERGGPQVLAGASIEEMHRPVYAELDLNSAFGVAFMVARRGEYVHHGHGGGIHGFITRFAFHKPSRTGVIALTNSGGGSAELIALEMLDLLLAAAKEQPPAPAERDRAPVPAPLRPYLGLYTSGLGGPPLRVEYREGVLQLVLPLPPTAPPLPPTRLRPTETTHTFIAENGRYAGEPVVFALDGDGRVTGADAAGFPLRRLVEASA